MDTNPRLLIVDDEEPICRSCERIFGAQGFDVRSATDPERGLALATSERFDTILLDMKMPQLDGIGFLERLREAGSEAPVIVITGYASVDTAARFMRLGAVDYVAKPFTPREISEAVARLVQAPATQPPSAVEPAVADELLFDGRSWARVGADGSLLVGAWLDRGLRSLRGLLSVAEPGERLERGMPWASLHTASGRGLGLPSPVDGVVVARNDAAGWADGAVGDWVLRVRPVNLSEALERLSGRRALVVNKDPSATERLVCELVEQGFEVTAVSGMDEAWPTMLDEAPQLVLVDDASATPAEIEGGVVAGVEPVVVVTGAFSPSRRLAWRLAGAHDILDELGGSELEALVAATMLPGERVARPCGRPVPASARLQHLVLGVGEQARSLWLMDGCVAAESLLGSALLRCLGENRPMSVHRGAGGMDLDALHGDRPVVLVHDTELRAGAVERRSAGTVIDGLPGLRGREVLVLAVGSMVTGDQLELDARSAGALATLVGELLGD
jgi:DNA-binding response OmpR family regulator